MTLGLGSQRGEPLEFMLSFSTKKSRHSTHSTIFAVVAVKVSYTDGRKDLPTAAAKCNTVHQAKSFSSVAC